MSVSPARRPPSEVPTAPGEPDLPDELEPRDLQAKQILRQLRLDGRTITGSATGAEAPGVHISECALEGVDLTAARLANLALTDVSLRGCNLANVDARGGSMTRVSGRGCRMTGLQWTEGGLRDVTLSDCHLDFASLAAGRVEQVIFERCQLRESDVVAAAGTFAAAFEIVVIDAERLG